MRATLYLRSPPSPSTTSNPLSKLTHLKVPQLKTLATSLGAATSGNKSHLCQNIDTAVSSAGTTSWNKGGEKRIISIDMGIRNLAYAHLVIPKGGAGVPILRDWERMDVTTGTAGMGLFDDASSTSSESTAAAGGGASFDPEILARHAYTFVDKIITAHQPTHILIERQRFRSGGGTAVLEWSLRVGVFAGMLHALFHGLARERSLSLTLETVDPGRVVRYWAQKVDNQSPTTKGFQKTASTALGKASKDIKKFKIDITSSLLSQALHPQQSSSPSPLSVSETLQSSTITPFLNRANRTTTATNGSSSSKKSHSSKAATPQIKKIDDLADCLLSGITWLEWKNTAREMYESSPIGGGQAGLAFAIARKDVHEGGNMRG